MQNVSIETLIKTLYRRNLEKESIPRKIILKPKLILKDKLTRQI